jgi:hypothetical protein
MDRMKQQEKKEKPTIHPNEVRLVTITRDGKAKNTEECELIQDEIIFHPDYNLSRKMDLALNDQYRRQVEVLRG